MRILNIVLFAAACLVIFLLGSQADSSATAAVKDPNPMKANEQQYSRMQHSEPMNMALK